MLGQSKFDAAEFFVNNKQEILEILKPELTDLLATKRWFVDQGLLLSFEDAFADWLEYKFRWEFITATGKTWEESAEIVDKSFLVDIFGEKFLKSEEYE
jgi:hypothetical protein